MSSPLSAHRERFPAMMKYEFGEGRVGAGRAPVRPGLIPYGTWLAVAAPEAQQSSSRHARTRGGQLARMSLASRLRMISARLADAAERFVDGAVVLNRDPLKVGAPRWV